MKTRTGFVSNSSSSSFIVIGLPPEQEQIDALRTAYGNRDTLAITSEFGCHEFGWEHEKYTTFGDRVMFAFIQADYVQKERPEWKRMLNKVLKKHLKVKRIIWGITTKWGTKLPKEVVPAYIDHQSASTEGENIDMFDSEVALTNFLFSSGSYIQGGNDNE